jgi:hypothetical protein
MQGKLIDAFLVLWEMRTLCQGCGAGISVSGLVQIIGTEFRALDSVMKGILLAAGLLYSLRKYHG